MPSKFHSFYTLHAATISWIYENILTAQNRDDISLEKFINFAYQNTSPHRLEEACDWL